MKMSSFGAFVAVFGVVVGVFAVSLAAYRIYHERMTRKERLRALEESERAGDGDRVLAALDELTMRDYARDAQAREAIDRNFWHLVASGGGQEEGDRAEEPDRPIQVAGMRVSAREIEDALRADPAVADAAVVGNPDERFGEIPHAYVVLREGFEASGELVKARLLERARETLPYTHRLKALTFVDEVPRTTTGKIMRRALEEIRKRDQDKL